MKDVIAILLFWGVVGTIVILAGNYFKEPYNIKVREWNKKADECLKRTEEYFKYDHVFSTYNGKGCYGTKLTEIKI